MNSLAVLASSGGSLEAVRRAYTSAVYGEVFTRDVCCLSRSRQQEDRSVATVRLLPTSAITLSVTLRRPAPSRYVVLLNVTWNREPCGAAGSEPIATEPGVNCRNGSLDSNADSCR
jgi:hypothetical protein